MTNTHWPTTSVRNSFPRVERDHKISLCLPILFMKLHTQTLFSPGYIQPVGLTTCQRGLLLPAESSIKVTLLAFCWWQIFEVCIQIFIKTSLFFLSSQIKIDTL